MTDDSVADPKPEQELSKHARLDRWAANVRRLAKLQLLRPKPGGGVHIIPDIEKGENG